MSDLITRSKQFIAQGFRDRIDRTSPEIDDLKQELCLAMAMQEEQAEMLHFLLTLVQQGISLATVVQTVRDCLYNTNTTTCFYWMLMPPQSSYLSNKQQWLEDLYRLPSILQELKPKSAERPTKRRRTQGNPLALYYIIYRLAFQSLQIIPTKLSFEGVLERIYSFAASFRGFSHDALALFLMDLYTSNADLPDNCTFSTVVEHLQADQFSAIQSLASLSGWSFEVMCARIAEHMVETEKHDPTKILRAFSSQLYLDQLQPYHNAFSRDDSLEERMEHPLYPLVVCVDAHLAVRRTNMALQIASTIEKSDTVLEQDKGDVYVLIFNHLAINESVFLKSYEGAEESPFLRLFLTYAGKLGVAVFAHAYAQLHKSLDEEIGANANAEAIRKFVFHESRKSLILLLTTKYPIDRGLEILDEYWKTDIASTVERRRWAKEFINTPVTVPRELQSSDGFARLSAIFEVKARVPQIEGNADDEIEPIILDSDLDAPALASNHREKATSTDDDEISAHEDGYDAPADKEDNDLSSRAQNTHPFSSDGERSISSRESLHRGTEWQKPVMDSQHNEMIDRRIELAAENKVSNMAQPFDEGYLAENSQGEEHTEDESAKPRSPLKPPERALPRIDPGYMAETSQGEQEEDEDEKQRVRPSVSGDISVVDPGYRADNSQDEHSDRDEEGHRARNLAGDVSLPDAGYRADNSQGEHTETEDEKATEEPMFRRPENRNVDNQDTPRRVGFAANTFDSGYDPEGSQSHTEDETPKEKELQGYLAEGSQGENTEESEAFQTEDEEDERSKMKKIDDAAGAEKQDYEGLTQNELQQRLRANDTNERDYEYSGDDEAEEPVSELMRDLDVPPEKRPSVGNMPGFFSSQEAPVFEQGLNYGDRTRPLPPSVSANEDKKQVTIAVDAVPFQRDMQSGYRTDDAAASHGASIESLDPINEAAVDAVPFEGGDKPLQSGYRTDDAVASQGASIGSLDVATGEGDFRAEERDTTADSHALPHSTPRSKAGSIPGRSPTRLQIMDPSDDDGDSESNEKDTSNDLSTGTKGGSKKAVFETPTRSRVTRSAQKGGGAATESMLKAKSTSKNAELPPLPPQTKRATKGKAKANTEESNNEEIAKEPPLRRASPRLRRKCETDSGDESSVTEDVIATPQRSARSKSNDTAGNTPLSATRSTRSRKSPKVAKSDERDTELDGTQATAKAEKDRPSDDGAEVPEGRTRRTARRAAKKTDETSEDESKRSATSKTRREMSKTPGKENDDSETEVPVTRTRRTKASVKDGEDKSATSSTVKTRRKAITDADSDVESKQSSTGATTRRSQAKKAEPEAKEKKTRTSSRRTKIEEPTEDEKTETEAPATQKRRGTARIKESESREASDTESKQDTTRVSTRRANAKKEEVEVSDTESKQNSTRVSTRRAKAKKEVEDEPSTRSSKRTAAKETTTRSSKKSKKTEDSSAASRRSAKSTQSNDSIGARVRRSHRK